MKRFIFAALLASTFAMNASAEDWTRFRGPNGTGVSTSTAVPTEWSSEKNMKWSVDLPGKGSSCPIVLGDRVYLTCYTGYGIDKESPGTPSELVRHLIAFDKNSGQEIWRSSVKSEHDEDPYKGFIQEHGYASSTPVTDGKHIFVLFGKTGMVAFDVKDGSKVWTTNLGTQSDPAKWGGGASAALYKDLVVVNAGNVGHQLVALNKQDGKVVWSMKDKGLTNCWSTPIVVSANGRDEMVFSVPGKILALDPMTGNQLWHATSPIAQTVCGSLAEKDGVVFAMGGRAGRGVAIKCGGMGDVTETHTVWSGPLRSGIGTPVVVGSNMYWTTGGKAYCASCESGEIKFATDLPKRQTESAPPSGRRMPAGDYASAIAVGDSVFLLTRKGATHVIKAGDEMKLVAQNYFDGDDSLFNATPAVSDNELYVRSEKKLYCISATPSE